jgi:TM2 domain-containing membrane protein YozV
LGSEVPDKKHMAFFGYGLALFFGGLFGLDSFLVGDNKSGIIRLVSLITLIFAPVALFWWFYKLFKFFFSTKDVINENWEYFGAPAPATIAEKFLSNFPILGTLFGPIIDAIASPAQTAKDVLETALKPVTAVAAPIVEGAIETAEKGIETVKSGIDTAKLGIETGAELGGKVINTISSATKAATALGQLGSTGLGSVGDGATFSAFTVPKAAAVLAGLTGSQQGGGSGSNVLAYTLIGTLGLIAVSGFILTYRRSKNSSDSKKNGKQQRDDPPPSPSTTQS